MSIFERRHYVKLAEFVKYDLDRLIPGQEIVVYIALSKFLHRENPNFKEDRFRKACGLTE